jgi:hypothetical protein
VREVFIKENKMSEFSAKLDYELEAIRIMLNTKNNKYGNSALEPMRVFSKASNLEQLYVRIDDKLSRIRNNPDNEDEDVLDDLIGYLLLLKIATR